ncbi:MAG: DegT/DnrJ/EryC1/StrS family aminotransferase, partial [Gammaproteobacteria bacterium]|nr:DegT/DnrJ/EryC1/StrS family aminotransferase [Gammaproteobacteria bacterium]
ERRRAAHHYSELLKDVVEPPHEDNIGTHVYHQYVALSDQRDAILKKLSGNDIAGAIYYPIPLHQQPVFAEQCKDVKLPVSEQISQRCFALPIHPELSNQQIEKIVDVIKSAV